MAELFLARQAEQDQFGSLVRHALAQSSTPDHSYLVVVHGLGGIGKTELLKRYRQIALGRISGYADVSGRLQVVAMDWAQQDSRVQAVGGNRPPTWSMLDALYVAARDALAGGYWSRRHFQKAFAPYREFAAAVKTTGTVVTPQGEPQLPELLGTALVASSGLVLGIPPAAAEGISKVVAQASRAARPGGLVDDRRYGTLVGAEEAAGRAFASGLKAIARRRPVVFILDTVEVLGQGRKLLQDLASRCGPRVVWVWGVRLEEEATAAWDSDITLIRRTVEPALLRIIAPVRFDNHTITRYLQARLGDAVGAEGMVEDVWRLTRGNPFAVYMATNLLAHGVPREEALAEISPSGKPSEVISAMARRYLIHIHRTDRRGDLNLIYGLAILDTEQDDPDLLGALWDMPAPNVSVKLDELCTRHDFMMSRGRRLHPDVARTIRIDLLDAIRRSEIREANRRAVELLHTRMQTLSTQNRVEAQFADSDWCGAALLALWHAFWVDPRDGLVLLGQLLPAATVLAPRVAAAALERAKWFEPILTDDQRLALASLRSAATNQPLITRLRHVFERSALSRGTDDSDASSKPSTDVLFEDKRNAAPILANDIPAKTFMDIFCAGSPLSSRRPLAELVELLELAGDSLPQTGASKTSATLARQATALAHRLLAVRGPEPELNARLALRAAEIVSKNDPRRPESWELVATCQGRLGQHDEAQAAYEVACRLAPKAAVWHSMRGMSLAILGREAQALECHAEAFRLEPNDARLHAAYAYSLAVFGRHESALEAIDKALMKAPRAATWHARRAFILSRLGRHEEAVANYTEATRLAPDNAQWHGDRALILGVVGQYEDALASLDRALQLDPEMASLKNNRGEALIMLDRLGEAAGTLERLIRSGTPDTMEAHVLLAAIKCGTDPEVAQRLCRAALDMPGERVTEFRRAELRALAQSLLGLHDRAEVEFMQAASRQIAIDAFQPKLYRLIATAVPTHTLERLLAIWATLSPRRDVAGEVFDGPRYPDDKAE